MTVTLVPETSMPSAVRTFVSTEDLRVVIDPSATSNPGEPVIYIPSASTQLGIRVVGEDEAFPIPALARLKREPAATGDVNFHEALAGTTPQVGSGIYVPNQEYVGRFPLMSVPGLGLSWSASLTYRSRLDAASLTPVGLRWTHNYDLRIRPVSGGVEFYNGDGAVIAFEGSGPYKPEAGFYGNLVFEPVPGGDASQPVWQLHMPDLTVLRFRSQPTGGFFQIDEIVDSNGNRMAFRYGRRGELLEVTDPYDRKYEYRYDSSGRLAQIVDFLGRTIRLRRAEGALGALKAIELPAVRTGLVASAGARRTIEFEYDGALRLESARSSKGRLFRLTYRDKSGRVAAQTLGTGDDAYTIRLEPSKHPLWGAHVEVRRSSGATRHFYFQAGRDASAIPGVAAAASLPPLPASKAMVPSRVVLGAGAGEEVTELAYNHHLQVTHTTRPLGNKLLVDQGFTREQIGLWVGTWGALAAVIGSLVGGLLATKLTVRRALTAVLLLRLVPLALSWWITTPQALASGAPSAATVIGITCLENAVGAALTTILFAFMMASVDRRIGATHYTLLASVEVFGKSPGYMLGGLLADHWGIPATFFLGVLLSAWVLVLWKPQRLSWGALLAAAVTVGLWVLCALGFGAAPPSGG